MLGLIAYRCERCEGRTACTGNLTTVGAEASRADCLAVPVRESGGVLATGVTDPEEHEEAEGDKAPPV